MTAYNFLYRFRALALACGIVAATTVGGCASADNPAAPQTSFVRVGISSLPNAQEASPGVVYAFSPFLANEVPDLQFEWNFDDGGEPVVRSDKSAVQRSFAEPGNYLVRVRVRKVGESRIIARDSMMVHVRGQLPAFPTVEIQPGTFRMGSALNYYEGPVHEVRISRRMIAMATEVKQELWTALWGVNLSFHRGSPELPAEQVSWLEAADFCNRLSLRQGLEPSYTLRGDSTLCDFTKSGWRLPTEAEWEYMARAGTAGHTHGGELLRPLETLCGDGTSDEPVLNQIAWWCGNSDYRTHPAGTKQPNAWGLYDMLGNVSEWCFDPGDTHNYSDAGNLDPVVQGDGSVRTVRGGSFTDRGFQMRSSARLQARPVVIISNRIGFRAVRTIK